jgi:hypothetical protein
MKLSNSLLLVSAAAGIVAVIGCYASTGPTQTTDELAWKTLAEISTPTQSNGATAADTLLSWRLWWTSGDVFPNAPTSQPPQSTNARGTFQPLPCEGESEKLTSFTGSQQPASPCEVVWLNSASAGYVFANGLWTREHVISEAKAGTICFPQSADPNSVDPDKVAIEMKTEWRPLDGSEPVGAYVFGLDQGNQKRKLVAFHMMIHARPNWVWATFIHESLQGQVSVFHDQYGAYNNQPSTDLNGVLAGHNVQVLSHYKLIGTQSDFETRPGSPTLLGNPLIEPADLIQKKQISCISCHYLATISNEGGFGPHQPQVGQPKLKSNFYQVNFNFTLLKRARCQFHAGCSDS